jgi:hypothetical protein
MFPSEKDFSIGDPQINDGIKTQYKINKKMEKKVFNVKDNTIRLTGNNGLGLWDYEGRIVGSTFYKHPHVHLLPQSLIRTTKSDEELAEKEYPIRYEMLGQVGNSFFTHSIDKNFSEREAFLAGRKSVGGDYHLTREDLEKVINDSMNFGYNVSDKYAIESFVNNLIDSLTLPIYPHTIEVEHDGENYLWETLNAIY